MKQKPAIRDFGRRLANLRKQRGLTQRQLAEKVGVSYRMVAYYEAESKHIPAHLLVPLSKVLRVSLDELVGIKPLKQELDPEHAALWRRLKKAERLSRTEQKALLHYLDTMLRAKSAS